ncbi:hypothetical protein H8R23_01995 [Flavobacterium sp. F-380]|uniref:Transglutaminase-like domain-containing protein n=1 Tax=Flavobacterium kayseriense TaxID=2764714 RepID=A0ABR7J418_9FLAO|nr:transglutaminase domain-containing protein [Flavobacterium kayseriense]MBC5840163.1 hypothetical protein [Flavobacterium kayseriense]MBC5847167.1 hypothetical protein [Flavobacterium kayseriense]
MKSSVLVFTLLFVSLSFGQAKADYSRVDSPISKIPASATVSTAAIAAYIQSKFTTPDDKIRAVFYWTTANISYDVANRIALQQEQLLEDRIAITLKTRKGVCKNYAEVFSDLANKLGVQTVIIRGYTKQYGIIGQIPHAWCASKISGNWYLFDPTWAAGYIDAGQFKKRFRDTYYKVQPEQMIKSHMPYDYVWQFLNYPITNAEFTTGKLLPSKAKKYVDFEQEIAKAAMQDEEQQLTASSKRIRENGITNTMIAEVLSYNDRRIAYVQEERSLEQLNVILKKYNEGVAELNQFIAFKNRQFKPVKNDQTLISMILSPYDKLVWCQKSLSSVGSLSEPNRSSVIGLQSSLKAALQMTIEHKNFVYQYVEKSPISRDKMFYKSVY